MRDSNDSRRAFRISLRIRCVQSTVSISHPQFPAQMCKVIKLNHFGRSPRTACSYYKVEHGNKRIRS